MFQLPEFLASTISENCMGPRGMRVNAYQLYHAQGYGSLQQTGARSMDPQITRSLMQGAQNGTPNLLD